MSKIKGLNKEFRILMSFVIHAIYTVIYCTGSSVFTHGVSRAAELIGDNRLTCKIPINPVLP